MSATSGRCRTTKGSPRAGSSTGRSTGPSWPSSKPPASASSRTGSATAPEPAPTDEPRTDLAAEADLSAEADLYAIMYPRRAVRIRALGGLPQPLDFGAPSEELLRAIITGDSPGLRALDAEAVA